MSTDSGPLVSIVDMAKISGITQCLQHGEVRLVFYHVDKITLITQVKYTGYLCVAPPETSNHCVCVERTGIINVNK